MISSSFGPHGRFPLYRRLAFALASVALLAMLGLWAAVEAQEQFAQPAGTAVEQRLAVLLLLQSLCAALIVGGVMAIAHRAYHVLVRQSTESQDLLPPAARERGSNEVERLIEGLAEFNAQDAGRIAAEGWQSRVDAAQLTRYGMTLHALHQSVRLLSRADTSEVSLRQALQLLEAALGSQTVALQLHGQAIDSLDGAALIDTRGEPRLLASLGAPSTARRHGGARVVAPTPDCPYASLLVPLACDGRPIGTLVAQFRADERLDDTQVQLAESFARLAGTAIAALSRRQEERRMALMEERGAIAAELHDSLAQALSYMKIQVARLQAGLDRDAPREDIRRTSDELREGLSLAYREVRELIAAFRVRVGPGGLRAALQDAIDGFGQRSQLEISYADRIGACPLEPNEELHVLQLVREALSNAVRHAQARQVWVTAEYRVDDHQLTVTIEDDGLGLDPDPEQSGHYGLGIMRERARSLRGHCSVEPREGSGTRVRLAFSPQRFPAERPIPHPP